ncbi:hypothetical protein FQA39_LY09152 [Lamprigera yunnana]|nr:hypothetical protein FQA39_LY09152 [Lamprigera yunnana]
MEPNRLLSDELSHELIIKNTDPTKLTVDKKNSLSDNIKEKPEYLDSCLTTLDKVESSADEYGCKASVCTHLPKSRTAVDTEMETNNKHLQSDSNEQSDNKLTTRGVLWQERTGTSFRFLNKLAEISTAAATTKMKMGLSNSLNSIAVL